MRNFKFLFLKSWLLFVFFSSSSSFSQTNSTESILRLQNLKVLSGRVYAMLSERLLGVSQCDFRIQNDFLPKFKKFSKYTEDIAVLKDLLDLYYQSYQTPDKCRFALNSGEMTFHHQERKLFKKFNSIVGSFCNFPQSVDMPYSEVPCESQLSQILSELNPHCISIQIPYDPNFFDSFQCMMGDVLIGKIMYEAYPDPNTLVLEIKTFFHDLWNQANLPTARTDKIDLWNIFKSNKKDGYELRHRFLSVMTYLLTSTPTMSPYIKGFQDYIWRKNLLQTGNSLKSIELFISFRTLIDEYRSVKEAILIQKIPVKILDQNILTTNRHNLMSSFITCHYIRKPLIIRQGIPVLLGHLYESFDFISHLKEGDTLTQAKDNFVEDTDRYKTGVIVGENFCSL